MLREFDIFHQIIRLNYRDANTFSTTTGCFFTTCVIIITLIQGISTFRSILSFQSPQVTIERTELINPGYFTLNSSDFQFMINVEGGLNFSSSFLSVRMFYMKVFKYEDGTYGETQIEIPYKRCPSNYFKKFPVGTYPPELAETGICPDLSKIELNGSDYASDHFQRLGIILTKCVNNTNRPDIICKSSEEIEDFLKNPVIPIVATLFYTNTIISPTNYSTPSIYYLEYEEYYLPPTGFTMLVDVPINQQDLITDDNLLMEDWNTKSYTTYQIDPTEMKVRLSNQITDAGEEVMFTLWLRRSSKMYTTKRLYPKLQEGLASVGSVFTLCVAVFGIITTFYRNRAYAVNIANQLFEYDFYDPEK